MFQFSSGAVATTFTYPSTIKWLSVPTMHANRIYQVSIVNNLGYCCEWDNTSN